MSLLRSIRAFAAIAICALVFVTFAPLAQSLANDGAGRAPSMACQTCNHPDMAFTGCIQTVCPIIVKQSDIDHHAVFEPVRYAAVLAMPLHGWLTEPPVPPG